MSFILDALKKSENERQQQAPPEFATVPSSPDAPAAPRWLWVLGVLLAINIMVLSGVMLRPETAATVSEQTDNVRNLTVVTKPQTETVAEQSATFTDQLEEARRNLPERITSDDDATGLSDYAVNSSGESVSTVAADATKSTPARSNSGLNFSQLPSLVELRLNGELALPELHVDIHVFSANAPDRFVFINMNKYKENDQLSEGPVVREITRDGVILSHQGRSFSLMRE